MVTKLKKSSPASKTASGNKATGLPKSALALTESVKDSAQQIWQAGLGAFTKAQVEGSKAFEALVKEGVNFQRKTQSAAEEKISEATQKMTSMANDISSKASGQWDKLESIFEDRVAKALNKLGVPSAKDVNALMARIDALNVSVQKLTPKKPSAKPIASAPVKAVAKVAGKTVAAKAPSQVRSKKSVPSKSAEAVASATQVNPV